MALDQLLIDLLVCPEDKQPLLYLDGEEALYNPRLQRRYAVRDGIPILIPEEGEAVDDAEHARLVALGGVETGHGG